MKISVWQKMKYALVNNTKTEATKGVKGICPICDSELIAKCGERKINHWAHKGTRNCDPWWETETEWHRTWKNNYPAEWQETILFEEQTGEKHIADVRTVHNLIIEFQHSHINPQERTSREKFYKNMVWIVDGTRLQWDYPRFVKGFKDFRTNQQGVYSVDFPDEVFPKSWLNSSVPIIFDFCGLSTIEQDEIKNTLWCLLPQKDVTRAVVVGLRRKDFIQITHNRGQLFPEPEKPQQRQLTAQQQQLKPRIRHREGTHYYDHKKGKFVRKWRF